MPVVFDKVTADVQAAPQGQQDAGGGKTSESKPSPQALNEMRKQMKRLQARAARLVAD